MSEDSRDKRTHDVYFNADGRRGVLHNANHGVTLAGDHLAWSVSNKRDSALYDSIIEVRLQIAGAPKFLTHVCDITFADRYRLQVTDSNEFGIPTKARRAAYRAFVNDLHARLIAAADKRDRPPIIFIAGFDRTNYIALLIRIALWMLVFVGAPLAAFLLTGETAPFLLLIGAIFVGVSFWRMTQHNAPRTYDPARLPDDLIGATAPARARESTTRPPAPR